MPIARPIVRSIARPICYPLTGRRPYPAWLPSDLFALSQPGIWLDGSDNSVMWQDAAGTIPVVELGDPVGCITDKSGNNIVATQSTSASRPVWQEDANGARGLKFDGVDDWLVTPSIDFSASDKMLVSAGVRKLSDAAIGVVAEISSNASTNNGAFYLVASVTSLDRYQFNSRGTLNSTATAIGFAAPISNVVTGVGDIGLDVSRIRVDAAQAAESAADQGTGNYGNYPLYIGMRGGSSLPYNGFIHQLVVRGGDLPDTATIAKLEAYIAGKSGVSL